MMMMTMTGLCDSCGVPETVRHYVMECINVVTEEVKAVLPASQTGNTHWQWQMSCRPMEKFSV